MSLQCDGSVSVLAESQLAMGVASNGLGNIFMTEFNRAIRTAAKLECPAFTDTQIDMLYGTIYFST